MRSTLSCSITASWRASRSETRLFPRTTSLARSAAARLTPSTSSTTPSRASNARLDSVPAIDRYVGIEDFLQNRGVGGQAPAIIDQFFKQSLSIASPPG